MMSPHNITDRPKALIMPIAGARASSLRFFSVLAGAGRRIGEKISSAKARFPSDRGYAFALHFCFLFISAPPSAGSSVLAAS
jgi:hypothetical protein